MARGRALVLLLVPVGLLGPWVARFVDDWRLLLSGPGLVATGDGPGCLAPAADAARGRHDDDLAARARRRARPRGVCRPLPEPRRRPRSRGRRRALARRPRGRLRLGPGRARLGRDRCRGVGAGSPLGRASGLELWLAGLLVGLLAGSAPVLAALRGARRRWSFAAAVTVIAVLVAAVVSGAAVWAARGAGATLSVGRGDPPGRGRRAGLWSARGPPAAAAPLARGHRLRPRGPGAGRAAARPRPAARRRRRPSRARPSPSSSGVGVPTPSTRRRSRASASASSRWTAAPTRRSPVGSTPPRASAGSDRASRASSGRCGRCPPQRVPRQRWPPRARGSSMPPARSSPSCPRSGPHAAIDTVLPPGADGRRLVVAEPSQWADHAVVTLDGASSPRGRHRPADVCRSGRGRRACGSISPQPTRGGVWARPRCSPS